MTRARALWLAAGVGVLMTLGYLLQRRRTRVREVPAAAVPAAVLTAPAAGASTPEVALITETPVIEAAGTPEAHLPAEMPEKELPLATWARVAIVVVALVAFFAVSLVATKRV